jgi:hypothetical protein
MGTTDALAGLNSLPVGTILPFAGDVQHLPAGWYICNGDNGTVDLTNRMPMGLGVGGAIVSGRQPGSTGPNTGTATGTVAPSNLWTAGNAEQYPLGAQHTHTLPVASVYFIQRVE